MVKFHRTPLDPRLGNWHDTRMDGNSAVAVVEDVPELDLEEIRVRVAARRASPIKKLSDLHEALADWMLVNPGGTYREMGVHFNYSVSWLCTVVNSDMFQAYFAKRRETVGVFVAASLPKKLEAAAHLATEKIIGVLEKTEDPELINDCFDKILHRFGYAPNAKGGGAQAQVVNNTQKDRKSVV